MDCLGIVLTFLLCGLLNPVKSAAFDPCVGGSVLHRNFKSGETSCCHSIKCSAGHEAVMCGKGEPNSTSCRPCPLGTYQPEETDSVDMVHCMAKTTCYEGNQRTLYAESRTKDSACVCDVSRGFCNSDFIIGGLRTCRKQTCPVGFQLTLNCSCEDCTKGRTRKKNLDPCHGNKPCKRKREAPVDHEQNELPCAEDEADDVAVNRVSVENKKTRTPRLTVSPDKGQAGPLGTSLSKGHTFGQEQRENFTISDSKGNAFPLVQDNSVSWYLVIPLMIFLLVCLAFLLFFMWYYHREKSSATSLEKGFPGPRSSSGDTTETENISAEATFETLYTQEAERADCDVEGGQRVEETSFLLRSEARGNRVGAGNLYTDAESFTMRKADKEKLNVNRVLLVKHLIVDEPLWSVLMSNETITGEMKSQIERSDSTDSVKASAIVDYLQRRDVFAFETFIIALILTKQEHLASALDSDLTGKIKRTCPAEEQLMEYLHGLRGSQTAA